MEIKPFSKRIYLASPTMHGEELKYMKEAFDTNWMSTIGENINAVEKLASEYSGKKYAVGLSSCTSALHLCVKLAGERLYGRPAVSHGALEGKRVFCSDMTFAATLNPVSYEGGIPIFIDTEEDSWNMSPEALEMAFSLYPDVKLVVFAELYGFPGRVDEIKDICERHGALLIEDAAEAHGATYKGSSCGSFGDLSVVSYNGNKIITGSTGGALLSNDKADADKARKWSTQAREPAPWYQHEEIGYNYRMSNVVAGVIRGQYPHLKEHIEQKKAVYERYKAGFKDLPVEMNPILEGACPNYWLSGFTIDERYMCKQDRGDLTVSYEKETGKTCPTEILETLEKLNAEGRPIWKPMHMQPTYRNHGFVRFGEKDVGADIFNRGVCLPSDNKMTEIEQNVIIEAVKNCFR